MTFVHKNIYKTMSAIQIDTIVVRDHNLDPEIKVV